MYIPTPVVAPDSLKLRIELKQVGRVPDEAIEPIRDMFNRVGGVQEVCIIGNEAFVTVDFDQWPDTEPTLIAVAKNAQAVAMLLDNPFQTY